MNPLIPIIILFLLSLSGAIVLFKWLENTASVSTPIGKFGGAIAGFIGIFLMLSNTYSSFSESSNNKVMDVPNGYKNYISEKWGFGIVYPADFSFFEWRKREIIGVIKLETNSNISISAEELIGDELDENNKSEAVEYIVQKQIDLIKTVHSRHKIVSIEDYSVDGIKGKVVHMTGNIGDQEIATTLVVIPKFEANTLYFFDLTTTKNTHNRHLSDFQNVISTVEYFD